MIDRDFVTCPNVTLRSGDPYVPERLHGFGASNLFYDDI